MSNTTTLTRPKTKGHAPQGHAPKGNPAQDLLAAPETHTFELLPTEALPRTPEQFAWMLSREQFSRLVVLAMHPFADPIAATEAGRFVLSSYDRLGEGATAAFLQQIIDGVGVKGFFLHKGKRVVVTNDFGALIPPSLQEGEQVALVGLQFFNAKGFFDPALLGEGAKKIVDHLDSLDDEPHDVWVELPRLTPCQRDEAVAIIAEAGLGTHILDGVNARGEQEEQEKQRAQRSVDPVAAFFKSFLALPSDFYEFQKVDSDTSTNYIVNAGNCRLDPQIEQGTTDSEEDEVKAEEGTHRGAEDSSSNDDDDDVDGIEDSPLDKARADEQHIAFGVAMRKAPLIARETLTIKSGETRQVPLEPFTVPDGEGGVVMSETPLARHFKLGLSVSRAFSPQTYNHEALFLENMSEEDVTVEEGDEVAEMLYLRHVS